MDKETKQAIEKIRLMGYGDLSDRLLFLGDVEIESNKEKEIRLLNKQIMTINARLKELNSNESKH